MSKERNFAEIAPNIGFFEFDFYDLYREGYRYIAWRCIRGCSELMRRKWEETLVMPEPTTGTTARRMGYRHRSWSEEGRIKRGEEGERPCQKGTCQGEGDRDGGLVRHTERALRLEAGQGPDEADGNLVNLLRHTHGKRGAAGRQDRAERTSGGCLKRKHAHRKVLSQGNCTPVIENGQKIRPKRPEWDIKT